VVVDIVQLPWVELVADLDDVEDELHELLVEDVVVELVDVAVVAVEPTEARSSEAPVAAVPDDEPVDAVVEVDGAATASAAVPPTTPIAAADTATMRDRRVRLQRRRVAVLIRGLFMAPTVRPDRWEILWVA